MSPALAPGVNVVAVLNDAADPDIFTMHVDGFSNPALAHLIGFPDGRAMWFNFIGLNPAGHPVYALYLDQGVGFFFVANVVL